MSLDPTKFSEQFAAAVGVRYRLVLLCPAHQRPMEHQREKDGRLLWSCAADGCTNQVELASAAAADEETT